ncbi:MAG: bifunctional precorrin-2 dehydrogenase/sirohydrochlorin ferrochelatase [Dehalococcoidia bacterium]|nr:MAG: bifunctional precorrin-2 dehydrogenase/sirohydrochlorin ferrochelatase [Dehalococcoidia bacterium]
MNPYYSIFINIKGRRCVVIGGGKVALRKVKELLEHNAEIVVVSPRSRVELGELAKRGKIQILKRSYKTGDLENTYLAIAATGDKSINKRAAKEAKEKHVILNVVDNPELSDFIVPSVVHRGDISIAVSTGGKSPALARKIRTGLEEYFAGEYASLARMISDVRTELRKQGIKIAGDQWQEAIDVSTMINLLREGDEAAAKAFLVNGLKKPKCG